MVHGKVADVRQSRRHHLRERPGHWCGRRAGLPKVVDCGGTAVKSVPALVLSWGNKSITWVIFDVQICFQVQKCSKCYCASVHRLRFS